jgi:glycosyl transferase family 87
VAALAGARLSDSLLGTDFPDFYCAARMLAEGHGHQLYDAEVQRQYQVRYAGRIGTLYIHPPFETVLYLTVAWLPMRGAYLLWFLLSVTALAAGMRRLTKEAFLPWDWRILFAASLTFIPVLLCLMQGQDSLLLLLLVILAFTALGRGEAFAAGCWLGLGLFKLQLVLPIALVLAFTQSRNVKAGLAKGFGLVAMALAGLSVAICGWPVFAAYPKFLAHLAAQPFAGIIPEAMSNFRGLTYFFFQREQRQWAIAVVSVLSVGALVMTLILWKPEQSTTGGNPAAMGSSRFDFAFANTVLFALLVSYHLNPHDLSLLLLPMVLLLRDAMEKTQPLTRAARWLILALSAVLFLPPLHLLALRSHVYAVVSIPLVALFALGVTRRGSSFA